MELTDEFILEDALSSQRSLTQSYNGASNSAAGNDELRSDLLQILMEEHQLQSAMLNWACRKGWRQPRQASQLEIKEALKKYCSEHKR